VVRSTGEPFSLLLPVYGADSPSRFARAFESATTEQSRPPDEVVVVCDGPLAPRLDSLIEGLALHGDVFCSVVRLPVHRGLGNALNEGLFRCRHEIVARMDADDVSLPARFERQLPLLEDGFDIVGSALAEIGHDEADVRGVRRPPPTHAGIARFARFHSPFNHPTVVFRRSVVMRVGGYQHLPGYEDYWLWVRLLAGGARAANVTQPLVLYRVGTGSYERRGGIRMARHEIALQRRMRRLRFTTRWEFGRNVIIRGAWRLVPVSTRRVLYGRVFRSGATRAPEG
jgi:glycosyltransferase involved in cell wall biosynthesis